MNDASTLVARYLEAWNESDAARRAQLIAQLWSADARCTDPLADARGTDFAELLDDRRLRSVTGFLDPIPQ